MSGPHQILEGDWAGFCNALDDREPSSSLRLTPRPTGQTDSRLGYYEYLPPGYGGTDPAPLLVFLHGFGANGDGSATSCAPARA